MDSFIGELFDNRYLIEKRLGSGGMADVFLARDESLGRRVAIKILAERYAQDEGFLERFRREASAAAGLGHPNIVSIYDRGQAAGTSYIAMEYLTGPTLKDEISRRAPLPEAEAVNWAGQALDALEFAHRQGVIHRDVKPHNMVLTDEGRLKVTDFGIARAANTQQMTEVGSIVGTAQYLSPEQARGLDVGAQSDLYSMGIVLYEMLTGELPFTGESAVEIAMKQVSDAPPSIRKRNRLVSEELEQVVMRALAKDPALRHRSAREMSDELRRVSRGGAVSNDTQQATRVMAGVGAAAVGGGAGATEVIGRYAGTPTTVLPSERPSDRRPPPSPVGPQRSILPWLLVIALLIASAVVGYVVYQQLSGSGVTVPTLNGDCQSATSELQQAHLKAQCKDRESSLAQKGRVVGSDPPAGSSVDKNSTVTVFIGKGPNAVAVPDVAGKTILAAQGILQAKGFTVDQTVTNVNSPKFGDGLVVGTDPPAGNQEPPGTVIRLHVATGNVVVPGVAGQTCDEATATLKKRTLTAQCQNQPSDAPQGTAFQETPRAGQTAPRNSTVVVSISSGPAQANLPDVVGDDKNDAQKQLRDAGFQVQITQQIECTDPTQNNIVSDQSPAGGTQADQGSTVTITVLKYKPNDPSCVAPPPT